MINKSPARLTALLCLLWAGRSEASDADDGGVSDANEGVAGTDASDATDDPGGCGDGAVDASREACDDGNVSAGDGCDAACAVEDGWHCDGPALVNGDFEADGMISASTSLTGWTVGAGNVDTRGDPPYDQVRGAFAVDLNGLTTGTISQRVDVTAGEPIAVSWFLASNATDATVRVTLADDASTMHEATYTSTVYVVGGGKTWDYHSVSVTPTSAVLELTFASQTLGTGGNFLDVVRLITASVCQKGDTGSSEEFMDTDAPDALDPVDYTRDTVDPGEALPRDEAERETDEDDAPDDTAVDGGGSGDGSGCACAGGGSDRPTTALGLAGAALLLGWLRTRSTQVGRPLPPR